MAGSRKLAFGLRALHSLSGVVPVGLFMLLQVWAHAKALDGAEAHRLAVVAVHPASWAARILIGLPLLFHVGYGLVLIRRPRYNVGRYPLSRNWTFTLQRATGVIALLFIGLAIALAWKVPPQTLAQHMTGALSQTHAGLPLVALTYLFGLSACVFHFVVGLWMITVRYGFAATRSAQTQAGMAFGIIGLALMAWCGHTVVFVATGWAATPTSLEARNTICDPAVVEAPPASASAPRNAPLLLPRHPQRRPTGGAPTP